MSKTRIFRKYDLGDGEKQYLSVSYSQLEVFLGCPKKWFKYYLRGEGYSTDSESTELGSTVHSSIEEYCLKLSDGYEFTVAEAQELVKSKLDERTIKFEEEEDIEIVEQHLEMAEQLVDGYYGLGALLKKCDIVAQELEFRLVFDLPFEVLYKGDIYKQVVMVGFIDLVLKDKETGEFIIVDHKTGRKLFEEDKLWNNYQFPIYQLAILNMYGKLPSKCYYHFTRYNKLQEVHTLVLNDDDMEVVKYFIRGKNKGKPKYVIKSVNKITEELTDIFRLKYQPTEDSYAANGTALCSWCIFSPRYGEVPNCDDAYDYERKDIPPRTIEMNATQYNKTIRGEING